MKFRFAAALPLLLLLGACDSTEGRFTVHGIITDELATAPGSMVYLIGQDGPVDSVKVKDTEFSFTGPIDKTKILTVTLRFPGRDEWDTRFTAAFVPDSELIGIDLDYPVTVTGSPLTDAVNEYQEQVLQLYYQPELDTESLELEGEELDAYILDTQMPKRVALSRQTYLANTDNALGLQAFSMLITELDREELEELFLQGGEVIQQNRKIKELIESK